MSLSRYQPTTLSKIRSGFCFSGVRDAEEGVGNRKWKYPSKPTVSKLTMGGNKHFEENGIWQKVTNKAGLIMEGSGERGPSKRRQREKSQCGERMVGKGRGGGGGGSWDWSERSGCARARACMHLQPCVEVCVHMCAYMQMCVYVHVCEHKGWVGSAYRTGPWGPLSGDGLLYWESWKLLGDFCDIQHDFLF